METLPIEMLERISQNLTAQDLAACAAVCRQWRDIFNDDFLWRPRCDVALEETLRTTPCVVEPGFVSPEMESGTLSPIGQWRLALMREKHLWNNWRRKNHKVATVPFEHECYTVFISNFLILRVFDCVLINNANNNKTSDFVTIIRLYNVETFPPTLLKETTDEFVGCFKSCLYNENIPENKLIIFYGKCGIALNIDLETENIMDVKYKISLQNHQSEELQIDPRFEVTRTSILGYNPYTYSGTEILKIWDLEEGTELKVEKCPKGNPFRFENVITSKTTDNAVIVVSDDVKFDIEFIHCERSEICTYYFYIYTSLELQYLPFTYVCEVPYLTLYKCKIHYGYVAIAIDGCIKVYNYQSHTLLSEVPTDKAENPCLDVIDDCFAFVAGRFFKMFNPASQTFIVLLDLQIRRFRILSNSMVEMIMCIGHKGIWRIGKRYQKRLEVNRRFEKANVSSTRTLTDSSLIRIFDEFVVKTNDQGKHYKHNHFLKNYMQIFKFPAVTEWIYYW